MILDILHYPDKRLHLRAKLVTDFNDSLKKLVSDMAETMYKNGGIGLAATQVNVQLRVFVMDLSTKEEPKNLVVFINPSIFKKNGQLESKEGCLSVPGVYETVNRADSICLSYQDIDGTKHTIECDGLMAVCVQHEVDHLDGKVFVEYLSNLKQNFIKKKMKKIFKPV